VSVAVAVAVVPTSYVASALRLGEADVCTRAHGYARRATEDLTGPVGITPQSRLGE